ncbi:hypothetical protein D3C83_229660 [compost metagenome]
MMKMIPIGTNPVKKLTKPPINAPITPPNHHDLVLPSALARTLKKRMAMKISVAGSNPKLEDEL